MAISPFRKIQTTDKELNLLQDHIKETFDAITRNPWLSGKQIKQVAFAVGDNKVMHGLGRNYVGCYVAIPTSTAFSGTFGSGIGLFVEPTQDNPAQWIVINAIQPCVADLWVF